MQFKGNAKQLLSIAYFLIIFLLQLATIISTISNNRVSF